MAGLDPADLKHAGEIARGDITYRLLDPISMLKAKACNFSPFKRDGDPPRHEGVHLGSF